MRIAFCAVVGLGLAACARMETAQFQPIAGQESIIRDGQPVISSRQKNSLVLVRPASRQFQAGSRLTYVVAMYNMTNQPLQFLVSNVSVAQLEGSQARALKVHSYEELAAEEHNRQVARAVLTGLAAGANAASAANAGYYNNTATVYGPNGVRTVNVSGYDPTAAAIAQNRAAAQNQAMIANTIETGQRNMAILEKTIIKDDTLLPGEWYGGQLVFDPPQGDGPKNYTLSIQIGGDVHQIYVVQSALART